VDSQGRLGIGTTSPGYPLTVNGRISYNAAIGEGADTTLSSSGTAIRIADSSTWQSVGIFTAGSERCRIDSSGRLLVGTSSARSNVYFGPNQWTPNIQIEGASGAGGYTTSLSLINYSASGYSGALTLGLSKSNIQGTNTAVSADDFIGLINFVGNDGTNFRSGAYVGAVCDGSVSTGDLPTRLVFSTCADGASSPTERMRIASNGLVSTESNLQCKARLYWSSGADGSSLSTSSIGAATTTVYIGNAAIQVSSDVRLKENIANTVVDAAEKLKKVRVVDFTWNDPTDSSFNNRNARGVWTGLIAQELVEVFPFAVNAPRKEEDLSIDYDDEAIWTVDQNQLVPVLIKAFQQQQERIETLEAEVAALKAS
jgi:hypothetical protein